MSGLAEAYYIVGIVFMSIMLLIVVGILTVALIIKKKVNAIHDSIQQKVDTVTSVTRKGMAVAKAVGTIPKAIKNR